MTESNLPAHKHNLSWSGSHSHNVWSNNGNTSGDYANYGFGYQSGNTYAKTITGIARDTTNGYYRTFKNGQQILESTSISINKDTSSTGSGVAINVMPPFVVKFCWERTA